jgi:hypothetical protein
MDQQQTDTLFDITPLCSDIPALLGITEVGYAGLQAERFIEALTGSASTPMTFQTFDPSRQRDDLNVVRHGRLGVLLPELLALNRAGAAVAVTVNETDLKGRASKNIVRVRAVFADEDEPFTNESPIKPDFVVRGRDGRRHLYWRVDDLDLSEFGTLQRAIATYFGSDATVCDLSRVMRVPGFRHWSDGSDVVPLVEAGGEPADDGDDHINETRPAWVLKAAFGLPVAPSKLREQLAPEEDLPFIDERIARAREYLEKTPGAVEGEHGDRDTFRVACALVRGFALSLETAFELMAVWNRRCLPPWTEADLRRKIALAESSGTEPIGAKVLAFPPRPELRGPTLTDRVLVSAEDFLAEPDDPHPSYLGPAVLPKGGICMVAGPSGSRKTWLMIQAAVSLATGRDLLGLAVPQPVKTLLLECESGRTHFRNRLRNVIAGMEANTGGNLNVLGPDTKIPRIGDELRRLVEEHRAEVVILDTQGYFWDGDENSNTEWKHRVVRPLKEISRSCAWSPSFILVHHFGKSDSGTGARTRGATAIENDADSVLYLERKKDDDLYILRFKKIRDGERLPEKVLAFDPEKHLLVQVEASTRSTQPSDAERMMYDWVASYARTHGRFRPKDVVGEIMAAFTVTKEIARKVPTRAAAEGIIKQLAKGQYACLDG